VAVRLAFAGLMVLAQPGPLWASSADTPQARLAAATALLEAADEKGLMAVRIDLIVSQSAAQYRGSAPDASEDDMRKFSDALRTELARDCDKLIAARAQYYAGRFSLQELQEWAGELRSPLGQKMTKIAPDITRDFYEVDVLWVKAALARAQARLEVAKDKERSAP
jgi:hypothetical protein